VEDWRSVVRAFLLRRTIHAVVEQTGIAHCRVEKMLHHLRMLMTNDIPEPFVGLCEADETFIGGKWTNKSRSFRKGKKAGRGHGTSKLPVVGVLSRKTGQVAVRVVERRCEETVIGFIVSTLNKRRAILYTDGYKMNRAVRKHGIRHFYVNHHLGEFSRGSIHTNGIEGFWGYLKRQLVSIGGIREDRLYLFVGEIAWRYNHRRLSRTEKEQALMRLVLSD